MDDIIKALKADQSEISQTDYAKIIGQLQTLGYTGRPERWHESKRRVKVVLPEKVEWFRDNPNGTTAEQIREALAVGKVYV